MNIATQYIDFISLIGPLIKKKNKKKKLINQIIFFITKIRDEKFLQIRLCVLQFSQNYTIIIAKKNNNFERKL